MPVMWKQRQGDGNRVEESEERTSKNSLCMKLVFKEYFCHSDLSHQLSAPLLGKRGERRQQLYSADLGSVLQSWLSPYNPDWTIHRTAVLRGLK